MYSFWIYLTLVEQLFVVAGTIILGGYVFGINKGLHRLQLYLCQFIFTVGFIILFNLSSFLHGFYFVKIFLLLLCFIVLFFWEIVWWFLRWNFKLEAEILYLFNIASMLLLLNSIDLVLIYLVLETQSLILYTLIVLSRVNDISFSVEASLKYYVLGGIATSGFL
jgi:NADH:ubiquinone oxidoreductase subunit 2 (subunit N)